MIHIFSNKKYCNAVNYILAYARNSKRTPAYKRCYRNIARHISTYEENRGIIVTSDNFTDLILDDYISFLKEKNLFQNTIGSIVDKTKYMFRRMNRDGYKVNQSVFDVSVAQEQTSAVYLSSEEIELVYNITVRGEEQRIARDLFVIGCLTGMRFSDYSKLTSKNIIGNTIHRKTKKTGESVIVPMHRIVREILTKNNGNFPEYVNSLQSFNTIIKRICKRAGINDKMLVERTRGNKIERISLKRYQMISSHTARRSFATNAYLAGIPTARIMLITGHKTEQAFFQYIRINKKENARELSEHPFFK